MFYMPPKKFSKLRNRHFMIADIFIFFMSPLIALWLRLDGHVNFSLYQSGFLWLTLLFLVIKLGILYSMGFYKRFWRYASIDELQQIAIAMVTAIVLQTGVFFWGQSLAITLFEELPRSLPLLDAIMSFLLVGAIRFRIRAIEHSRHHRRTFFRRDRVLIVGAGSAGVSLVQEMQRNPSLGLRPVAFVDDDPAKLNLRIRRLPVAGDRNHIPELVRSLHIRKVIIAMPTAPGKVIREVLDICQTVGVPTRTLPGIHEILSGRVSIGRVREVQIEDLLRREPVQMDVERVSQLIQGQKVLITGAGGSIGSELCRQVLQCCPAEILLLGHGENSVFNIQQELEKRLKDLRTEQPWHQLPTISACIADIRFLHRLEYAFNHFKPQIVFHAAAHKHVPMMEFNAPEAVTNNVQGTRNLVKLALKYDVKRFVMISTDKAVNPTNIMGASKRVAEMTVLQAAQQSGRPYEVVRFGNVLGSRGSVIPTFKRQIAEGGPVTVTHPDICRYFMTIPEAVQLVLQAAVIGRGGEVFMLDMGQPVKIVDLAKELIHLSGYELGKTMKIAFTGLRPGEKLYEELFIPGEQYDATQHQKLFVVTNASGIVPNHLDTLIKTLYQAAIENDSAKIISLLKQLVPGFKPQSQPTNPQPKTLPTRSQPMLQPVQTSAA
ncbi:MAG: polysaccharide biosynthesis protein [Leptolyngbya sp. SIO1D8]|nr:polysaccharide biosynthesis protein [Leptolyngbya sp. SIO1D8]